MRKNILKIALSAIMLLGAVSINADEEKAGFQSGNLKELTENWTQRNSLRAETSEEEDTTPPGEPWGAPVGDGWYPVLALMLGYSVYLFRRNKNAPCKINV
jgi:hypothetical protein